MNYHKCTAFVLNFIEIIYKRTIFSNSSVVSAAIGCEYNLLDHFHNNDIERILWRRGFFCKYDLCVVLKNSETLMDL